MMYEAKPWPGDTIPGRNNMWVVEQNGIPRFTRSMSESEAKVIAWALNAVADKDELFRYPNNDVDRGNRYDGPTDLP